MNNSYYLSITKKKKLTKRTMTMKRYGQFAISNSDSLEEQEKRFYANMKIGTLEELKKWGGFEISSLLKKLQARENKRLGLDGVTANLGIGALAWNALEASYGAEHITKWYYSNLIFVPLEEAEKRGADILKRCATKLKGTISERYDKAIAWIDKEADRLEAKEVRDRRSEENSHALARALETLLLDEMWAGKQRFLRLSCGAALRLKRPEALAAAIQADGRFTELLKHRTIQKKWEDAIKAYHDFCYTFTSDKWTRLTPKMLEWDDSRVRSAAYLFDNSANYTIKKIKECFGDKLEEVAKWAEAYFELDMNASAVEA